jgi:hypothetical protein
MASGEITFNGTEAFLIGGAGQGFKIMTEMVNMSRLYNAVASLGIVRRSLMEAAAFGRERRAFGRHLVELPLWRAGLADLAAEHLGLMFLVFEAIRQLDRADNGDESAAKLMRSMTPLAKGLGGKLAVFAASEGMELIGGNAYIEDHIMPRLLRDAQVLPIWEGTTNIQSLDLIRAFQKEGSEALSARCAVALKNSAAKASLVTAAHQKLADLNTSLAALAQKSPEDVQRGSRSLLELASRTLSVALLLEAASVAPLKDIVEAAAERLLARPSATAPLAGAPASPASEEALIQGIF